MNKISLLSSDYDPNLVVISGVGQKYFYDASRFDTDEVGLEKLQLLLLHFLVYQFQYCITEYTVLISVGTHWLLIIFIHTIMVTQFLLLHN